MPEKKSYDPRVNRMGLKPEDKPFEDQELMQWQTYEVFQQMKRGDQHVHVGSLHAPNPDMAVVLAKEQFGRREQCVNLWVVKTADVHATSYDDADMFQHAFDKNYREGDGYRVKQTIDNFIRELDASLAQHEDPAQKVAAKPQKEDNSEWRAIDLPDQGEGKRRIIVRK